MAMACACKVIEFGKCMIWMCCCVGICAISHAHWAFGIRVYHFAIMSVPDISQSVIVLCDRIRERALSITEEHNAQLRHVECGELEAEHLAQRRHAECEELEAFQVQSQQAHANLGCNGAHAHCSGGGSVLEFEGARQA